MKSTKKFVALFAVLCMMVFMSACSGNANTKATSTSEDNTQEVKPLEIEFWHAMTGGNEEALQEIADDFNSENEDINVKLVYQGHYKELFQKLDGAAQAGQLPELTMIYPNRMTAYIMNGFGQDLTGYINDPEIGFTKEDLEDIPPVFMKGIWDEKYYTLPCNKSAYELFYNEDMLKAKNVEVPTTWDELRDAAEKLSVDADNDGNNEVVGLALNRSAGIDFSFWVEQAGGHLLSEDETTLLFNSEAGVEAFDFVTGMAKDGFLKIVSEDKYAYAPFARKEAAMIITSTSKVPDLEVAIGDSELNWNAAELPSYKNKAVLFTGTDMAMFSTNSDEEKLAAWKFMKYFMSKEATIKWGMNSGYLPVRYSALDSEDFKKVMVEKPTKEIAVRSFEYGFRDPKVLNGYAIHSNMQKALGEVLEGVKTSKEALDDARDQARKELDEAKKNFGK
ncbi:ABC transporter substrate-binding protein [Clostridium sediminicola]|uniref:ABC transporter substrate-binding protein n=1 Tax=Clostridium sediminicola TaxID=3114879 RepID=UPI0031F27060